MEISLQTPIPPVNMLSGYMSQQETTFTVHCYDNSFKYVAALDATGKPLFHVEGATFGTSWSWQRKVWDSSSHRRLLFDFRHKSFDIQNSWIVESPDGQKLCSFVHKANITSKYSAVHVTVRTEAGEDVLVLMRADGYGALKTIVSVDDVPFATIFKVNNGDVRSQRSRGSDWEVRAASGVDLSLVSVFIATTSPVSRI